MVPASQPADQSKHNFSPRDGIARHWWHILRQGTGATLLSRSASESSGGNDRDKRLINSDRLISVK